jgi:hypothetical protein
VDKVDSPSSVLDGKVFYGALPSLETVNEDGGADNMINKINATAQATPRRTFRKKGETLASTRSGKAIYIERVDSADSSAIETPNTGDYRNAMDRMRKLMIGGAAEKETEATLAHVKETDKDNSLDTSSIFADLVSPSEVKNSHNIPNQLDDDESTVQTSRHPGPIDVDTCARHITPAERRNLRAMHKLGYQYLRHNEINRALDVFMEILRGQRERHGKKSLEVAMAMHNLGVVCVKGGRFEEGTRLCDGAARIRVELLGKDHLDVAVSANVIDLLWVSFLVVALLICSLFALFI